MKSIIYVFTALIFILPISSFARDSKCQKNLSLQKDIKRTFSGHETYVYSFSDFGNSLITNVKIVHNLKSRPTEVYMRGIGNVRFGRQSFNLFITDDNKIHLVASKGKGANQSYFDFELVRNKQELELVLRNANLDSLRLSNKDKTRIQNQINLGRERVTIRHFILGPVSNEVFKFAAPGFGQGYIKSRTGRELSAALKELTQLE